jgi:hypothetical protein
MKLTAAVVTLIIFSHGCTLFEKDERLLGEHERTDGRKIKIYFVSLGATTNDIIQVRWPNDDKPVWSSDKYNYLVSSKLIDDFSLQLVLSDTGYHNNNNKLDTIKVTVIAK